MQTFIAWQKEGPRLIILDGFDSIADATQAIVRFQHPQFRLLITSRRKDFPTSLGINQFSLDVFDPETSIVFLERSLIEKDEAKETLLQLADKCGHLPLALELAANYLNLYPISIEQYIQEMDKVFEHESMKTGWFKELGVFSPTSHDQSLLATFSLSWEQVKDETQQKIFLLAGFCASNVPIPVEVFEQTLQIDVKTLQLALTRLAGMALLRSEGNLPIIHPLLSAYAQSLQKGNIELLSLLVNTLTSMSRKALETGLPDKFFPLRPHIITVVTRAEEAKIEGTSALLNNLGSHLRDVADYTDAKMFFERAIRVDEDTFGASHPNVAIGLRNLGSVLSDLGDLQEATIAFERALKIDESTYGDGHPNVANDLNNIGLVRMSLGDLVTARSNFEHSLKIYETTYGPDHPYIAQTINNLGRIFMDMGDFAGARVAFERSLEILEKNYGPDHPYIAQTVNNLGNVLIEVGDFANALFAFERSLKINEMAYGPEHPYVAQTITNLGKVLMNMGDFSGARSAFERSLKINQKTFGANHPMIANDLGNLGLVFREIGDLSGARSAFENALKINEAIFGSNHPSVALNLSNLGIIMQKAGDINGARAVFERALNILSKLLPPDHPEIKRLRDFLE